MKQGNYDVGRCKNTEEATVGVKVTDLYRKYGFSDETFYSRKAIFSTMDIIIKATAS